MLGREHLLRRPSLFESRADSAMRDAESPSPLRNCLCHSIIRDVTTVSFVVCLLLVGLPSAVCWLVVAIVIDPSYRCSWKRHLPHVFKKVLKGLQPACADTDSPQTVSLELDVAWVVASLLHRFPAGVLRSPGKPVRRFPAAPARFGFSTAKSIATNCSRDSTFATANPDGTFASPRKLNNRQLAVGVPKFVFPVRVCWTTVSASSAFSRLETSNEHWSLVATVASYIPVRRFATHFVKSSHDLVTETLPSNVFHAWRKIGRLVVRHGSTPISWIVVGLKRNSQFRLGSFHFSKN